MASDIKNEHPLEVSLSLEARALSLSPSLSLSSARPFEHVTSCL